MWRRDACPACRRCRDERSDQAVGSAGSAFRRAPDFRIRIECEPCKGEMHTAVERRESLAFEAAGNRLAEETPFGFRRRIDDLSVALREPQHLSIEPPGEGARGRNPASARNLFFVKRG